MFWLCHQALIPLALEGTAAGKVKASHALAKIASISNPEIAFPGERVRHKTVVILFISISVPFDKIVREGEWIFTAVPNLPLPTLLPLLSLSSLVFVSLSLYMLEYKLLFKNKIPCLSWLTGV